MRTLIALVTFLFIPAVVFSDGEIKRLLYMSTPDGAQKEGRARKGRHDFNGIIIFDIDNTHKFVKRIEVPIFKEGLRGFTANKKNHCVYFSTTNRRLGCFDVITEQVVWEKVYEMGCDRSSITPDGKKIYVPTGWWYAGGDSGLLVVNAWNGELIKRISVGPQAHNSITSLDGRFVFLGTRTMLTMFDTRDDKVIRHIKDVGERGVFPFTINSNNSLAYVCLGDHVGFDVVNLETGKKLHRVFAGEEKIKHRTHGAGLTPDESELWISDQEGKKLFIFDSTKMPPSPKGLVNLSQGGHGWVTFSLDGKYAYSHAPDIFDVKTKKLVGTFKDESGKPVSSSKFVEIQYKGHFVDKVGNEFGLGRK